tara:strand:- start:1413 stop:3761 length:2349 start_codon:yes stop_codon:yes gene_type:complete
MTDDIYDIDYETYSACDLRKYGAARYAEDDSTLILILAISKNGSDPIVWDLYDSRETNEDAAALFAEAVSTGSRIYAHNYQFEHFISKYNLEAQLGVPAPAITQWRCTAAMARRAAIPHSLGKCAEFLQLDVQKDKIGMALIQIFSIPKDKRRIYKDGHKDTEQFYLDGRVEGTLPDRVTLDGDKVPICEAWSFFIDYCIQDVITQMAIRKALPAFDMDKGKPEISLNSFQFDAVLNDRGMPLNVPALKLTQQVVEDYSDTLNKDFYKLTQLKPTQRAKVLAFLRDGGYPEDNLQAATIEAVDTARMDEDAQEALKMYSLLSFAAIKKIPTMLGAVNKDGRVRGTVSWAGAIRTHRWTGRLVQPQNMRRPTIEDTDTAYELLQMPETTAKDIDMLWDSPLEVVASCIRHFIHDSEYKLLDVDYSNIEARILAWLAGEDWKVEAFRRGEDLYKMLASVIFAKEVEDVTKAERFIGKTGELGCGYATGVDKFFEMLSMFGYQSPTEQVDRFWDAKTETIDRFNNAVLYFTASTSSKKAVSEARDVIMEFARSKLVAETSINIDWKGGIGSPEVLTKEHVSAFLQRRMAAKVVSTFRDQNPRVVKMWKEFDVAAKKAIENEGEVFEVAGGKIKFTVKDVGFKALLMRLPSGHCLVYPKPSLKTTTKTYKDKKGGEPRKWEVQEILFHGQPPTGVMWTNVRTYGARLVENACQAIGGDFLAHGLVVAEKRGYPTFAIIHDQALCPFKEEDGLTVKGYTEALCDLPDWAGDFPLDGDGGVVNYYTKD